MKKIETTEEIERKVNLYIKYNEFLNEFAHKSVAYSNPKNDYKLMVKLFKLLELIHMDKFNMINYIKDYYEDPKNRKGLKNEIIELQKMIKRGIDEIIDFIVRRKTKYFECPGRSYLVFNSKTNHFEINKYLGLSLDHTPEDNLTYLIDVTIWEMLFYIAVAIPADRFSICPRCGGLVFASTNRKKIYCGRKCTKAVIQEKYRNKKALED